MATKLALIKKTVCPPDGFRYVFPSDGYVSHSWTYDAWVEDALRHLQGNNIPPPPELAADMEDQLCRTLGPGWCLHDDPNRPRVSPNLGWNDVATGLKTFAKWIASGCSYVSQQEANRRALICSRCYFNTNVEGCAGCHEAVQEVTKSRSTKYDFALKACSVCKCLLKAKVHFPISTLDTTGTNQQLYPDFCWLKKDGANFNG